MRRLAIVLAVVCCLCGCSKKPMPAEAPATEPQNVQETIMPPIVTEAPVPPTTLPEVPQVPETAPEETFPPERPAYLIPLVKDFFTEKANPQGDSFYPDPNGEHYGFEQDYTDGCSVWCAVQDHAVWANASSWLKPAGQYRYDPANAVDGKKDTVWVEGVDGYGQGEFLEVVHIYNSNASGSGQKFDFQTLCIVNGYAQTEQKWKANSRVKELKLYINGEHMTLLKLEDTRKPQYFDISELYISALAGEEIRFRFEIVDTYPGDLYKDTCITGVELEFWTPNH